MSKGYAAVKWHEGEWDTKPIDVDTWPVRENKGGEDDSIAHPAGIVISLDLGDNEQAQVVFTRKDLMGMLSRLTKVEGAFDGA